MTFVLFTLTGTLSLPIITFPSSCSQLKPLPTRPPLMRIRQIALPLVPKLYLVCICVTAGLMFDSRALRSRPVSYLIITPRVLAQHSSSVIDSRQKEGREVGPGGWTFNRARHISFLQQAHSGLLKKEYSSAHGLRGGAQEGWS